MPSNEAFREPKSDKMVQRLHRLFWFWNDGIMYSDVGMMHCFLNSVVPLTSSVASWHWYFRLLTAYSHVDQISVLLSSLYCVWKGFEAIEHYASGLFWWPRFSFDTFTFCSSWSSIKRLLTTFLKLVVMYIRYGNSSKNFPSKLHTS